MLLGFIEGDRLLEVGSGRRVFSETEQDKSQTPVADRYEQRVVSTLSQAERLFGELTCPLVLGPHIVEYL